MKALNKLTAPKSTAPERIIQFGEGNFLRAFVDWIIYNTNQRTDFNASVVVVQPIDKGMAEWLNGQDCMYHVNLQGRQNGEPVNTMTRIDCISRALNPYSQNAAFMALADQPEIRFVISNTTEAGIAFDPACKLSDAPASSYPGKLTQLLYRRYKTFNGAPDKGLIILPCELIFLNGHHLKKCIYDYIELWKDDFGADYEGFKQWFTDYNYVCATLVDRIVPGFPRKEIKQIQEKICYADNLVVQAEIFHLWVIEAAENLSLEQLATEFPANKAGLNVLFVPSEAPYHERKVTLLNGPHTVLSPVAYLSGVDIVRDACNHPVIGNTSIRCSSMNLCRLSISRWTNSSSLLPTSWSVSTTPMLSIRLHLSCSTLSPSSKRAISQVSRPILSAKANCQRAWYSAWLPSSPITKAVRVPMGHLSRRTTTNASSTSCNNSGQPTICTKWLRAFSPPRTLFGRSMATSTLFPA